jgi:hypothetical protein
MKFTSASVAKDMVKETGNHLSLFTNSPYLNVMQAYVTLYMSLSFKRRKRPHRNNVQILPRI